MPDIIIIIIIVVIIVIIANDSLLHTKLIKVENALRHRTVLYSRVRRIQPVVGIGHSAPHFFALKNAVSVLLLKAV